MEENNTSCDLSSNHCFAYRGGASAARWCLLVLTVLPLNEWKTSKEKTFFFFFYIDVKNFLSYHIWN